MSKILMTAVLSLSLIQGTAGAPARVSVNGERELYELDDGRTAALFYDGAELITGYIIDAF